MRVKLVAVAKDEAAYLPEWIFHHLHFGFDHIEVNVNFSSDNTNAVLEKISGKNPVSYQNCEYVLEPDYDYNDSLINPRYLSRNPLQSRIYAKAYSESPSFDYVAFFDVDEYWCPEDFSTNIKDHIIKNGGGGVKLKS